MNVRVESMGNNYYQFKGINHETGALMGVPGFTVATDYESSGHKKLIWMGANRGELEGSGIKIRPLLIEQGSASLNPPNYPDGNVFEFYSYSRNGGYLKDLICCPTKTYKPNSAITKEYRAGIGVQSVGDIYYDQPVYNDPYQRDYQSTTTGTNTVKVIVLYKPNGSTSWKATSMCVLNSSIEMSGMPLN